MSQYQQDAIHKDLPVTVTMGWDNPIGGYFMVVEPKDENNPNADPETGYIYTNLDDEELKKSRGMSNGIGHYKKRLQELGIVVPELFYTQVLAD